MKGKIAAIIVLVYAVLLFLGAVYGAVLNRHIPYTVPVTALFFVAPAIGVYRRIDWCRIFFGVWGVLIFCVFISFPFRRGFHFRPMYLGWLLATGFPIFLLFFYAPLKRYTQNVPGERPSALSRILGWLLAWVGGLRILGFLFFELQGGSVRPFWIDMLSILVIGVLPLYGGIQLLRRRYETLKNAMRLICVGGIAVFVLCAAVYLAFPGFAARQLGVVAAAGLIASILSGVVCLTARTRWRSRQQRQAI